MIRLASPGGAFGAAILEVAGHVGSRSDPSRAMTSAARSCFLQLIMIIYSPLVAVPILHIAAVRTEGRGRAAGDERAAGDGRGDSQNRKLMFLLLVFSLSVRRY